MQVYSNGKVHVMRAMCPTCIFRPGNPMQLQPGRVAEMVKTAKAGESTIICHETTHGQREQEAACRGFWERYARDVMTLRLAMAFDIIDEVE